MTPKPVYNNHNNSSGHGHSAGGAIAMSLALSLPSLCSTSTSSSDTGTYNEDTTLSYGHNIPLAVLDFEETGEHKADSASVEHDLATSTSTSNGNGDTGTSYLVLSVPPPSTSGDGDTTPDSGEEQQESDDDRLPTPERVIFPVSKVRLGFGPEWRIGSGMMNMGNSCYLNSTLQALFHIPAFVNWLMSDENHVSNCTQMGSCIICGVRKTLRDSQQNTGDTTKPWQVYSKLRLICRHLTPGSQEDAHEFLRYLIEYMEKTYLLPYGSMDQYSKETTPINQIFGGYFRSSVRCLSCGSFNTTFQHFQDILIDIKRVDSLEEGLDLFFSKEKLEDCAYKCESCNRKVSATKQVSIERTPMVICIVMKRFSITGGKISKHLPFKSRISMKKYMYNQNNQSSNLNYNLVSMITHVGVSQNCGHYTAIGLGPENKFYQFDDNTVRFHPLPHVLGTNAYVLFYELDANSIKPRFIGPVLPDGAKLKKDSEPEILSLKMNCSIVKANSMGNFKPYNPVFMKRKDSLSESQQSSNGQQIISFNGHNAPSLSSNKVNGTSPKNTQADKPLPSTSSYLVWKKSKTETDIKETSDNSAGNTANTNGSVKLNREPNKPYAYKSSTSNGENMQNGNKHRKKENGNKMVVNDKHKSHFVPCDNKSRNQDYNESNKSKHTNNGTDRINSDTKYSNQSTEEKDVANVLKRFSYRGYGSQVNTWNGTHSQLNRQVFEDRKSTLKRPCEDDDLDRGRMKRVKYNNNEFYHSKNNYNPFDEQQSQRAKWNNNHSKKGRHNYHYYNNHKRPYHHHRHYNRNH